MGKQQTPEEYIREMNEYIEHGPKIDDEYAILQRIADLELIDPASKIDRSGLVHACELLYYDRKYLECISVVKDIREAWTSRGELDKKDVQRDFGALYEIEQRARSKVSRGTIEISY